MAVHPFLPNRFVFHIVFDKQRNWKPVILRCDHARIKLQSEDENENFITTRWIRPESASMRSNTPLFSVESHTYCVGDAFRQKSRNFFKDIHILGYLHSMHGKASHPRQRCRRSQSLRRKLHLRKNDRLRKRFVFNTLPLTQDHAWKTLMVEEKSHCAQ